MHLWDLDSSVHQVLFQLYLYWHYWKHLSTQAKKKSKILSQNAAENYVDQ